MKSNIIPLNSQLRGFIKNKTQQWKVMQNHRGERACKASEL